jgi:hypothetical protein
MRRALPDNEPFSFQDENCRQVVRRDPRQPVKATSQQFTFRLFTRRKANEFFEVFG